MARWLPVAGFEGRYEISDDGQVRSLAINRPLKGRLHQKGYWYVSLVRSGGPARYRGVHRLVAEAFIPNPLGLAEVNHKDLNKLNNAVSNLEWISHADNIEHARANGHFNPMVHRGREKKLTREDVESIRALREPAQVVAAKYGLTQGYVYKILRGTVWHGAQSHKHSNRLSPRVSID